MECLEFELPWRANQLKKLGKALRDGVQPPDNAPSYDEVMLFYSGLAEAVQRRIASLDWGDLIVDRPYDITARPKTLDTLVQKLQRDRSTPLPNVQDIAGVRFEAEMSLSEQDAVAEAIGGIFDQPSDCVHDLRKTPHSGYRAVHLWLKLPARVEIQVRTHLQGRWANMYESAADALGRVIRYGQLPEDNAHRSLVRQVQDISIRDIAQLEELRNELEEVEAHLADSEGLGRNWLVRTTAPRKSRNSRLLRRVDSLKSQMRRRERLLEGELQRLKDQFDTMKKRE